MKRPVSIIRGTAILTIAGLIVKVFGAVYRMYLSRLIGAEGIGLYQMAYPIYLIFLSLSTAGIPIAISKMVAEKLVAGDDGGGKNVLKAALVLMLLFGTTSSIGMAASARWVAAHVVADSRAVFSIWALSPAILLMSLMAVFRGYFQGGLNMRPTAYSQIFEQMVRVSVSLILACTLLKMGVEHAAAGAAFGATAGGAAGLIYLVVRFFRERRKVRMIKFRQRSHLQYEMRNLIRYALPISVTMILMPLLQTLDSVLVPNILQKIGYTIKQSTAMLGILGNSWAVIYLPLIVTGAISANLVPVIASLKGSRQNEELGQKVAEGLRIALIYLVPAVVGLYLFGTSIYRIIYGEPQINLLSWFAPAVLFLGLEQVSAGILQGLGRPKWPLISFLMGAFVKIIVTVISTGWPGLNLAGAALGTIGGAMLTAILNLAKIKQYTRFRIPRGWAMGIAGLGMFIFSRYLVGIMHFHYIVEFGVAGLVGIVLYVVVLWLLGGFNGRDLEIFKRVITEKGSSL